MKRILPILLLGVLWCIPAQALPAFVQSGGTNNFLNGDVTLTFTATNSIWVLCGVAHSTSATCTVDDNKSDSFTVANAIHRYAPGPIEYAITSYYAANVAGGSTVVTCHASANIDYNGCIVVEFSGASVLDQVAVGDNAAATGVSVISGTTSTTTDANEILLGGCYGAASGNMMGATAPWTLRNTQLAVGDYTLSETQVVSATGTYFASFDKTDRDTTCVISTFKASGGGGGATSHNLGLLGVGQ